MLVWVDHGCIRALILSPLFFTLDLNCSVSSLQWIMDVLVCNSLGIYCGMKTLAWLSMKPYQWQGLWNIPTYKYIPTFLL